MCRTETEKAGNSLRLYGRRKELPGKDLTAVRGGETPVSLHGQKTIRAYEVAVSEVILCEITRRGLENTDDVDVTPSSGQGNMIISLYFL